MLSYKDVIEQETKAEKLVNEIVHAVLVLLVIVGIVFLLFRAWVVFTYADVPLAECPTWVVWFLNE